MKLKDVAYRTIMLALSVGCMWVAWALYLSPWFYPPPPLAFAIPTAPVSIAGTPSKGNSSAKIVVIEFSDFECPFCGEFARGQELDLWKTFVDTGRVRWVFKHFPLRSIHPNALDAAEIASCSDEQGQFWLAHDLFFRRQDSLDRRRILELMRPSVADPAKFDRCTDAPRPAVGNDIAQGRALGITVTPSFLIGRPLPSGEIQIESTAMGVTSLQQFTSLIEKLSPR